MPLQQLLLPQSPQFTAQHSSYTYPLHQAQTPAYFAPPTTPTTHLHGYAGHPVASLGDVMVDLEEHLDATQTAYVVPTPAAPSPPAATPESNDDKFAILEKALHQVQGTDFHSY